MKAARVHKGSTVPRGLFFIKVFILYSVRGIKNEKQLNVDRIIYWNLDYGF